jgi:hypothetical protein
LRRRRRRPGRTTLRLATSGGWPPAATSPWRVANRLQVMPFGSLLSHNHIVHNLKRCTFEGGDSCLQSWSAETSKKCRLLSVSKKRPLELKGMNRRVDHTQFLIFKDGVWCRVHSAACGQQNYHQAAWQELAAQQRLKARDSGEHSGQQCVHPPHLPGTFNATSTLGVLGPLRCWVELQLQPKMEYDSIQKNTELKNRVSWFLLWTVEGYQRNEVYLSVFTHLQESVVSSQMVPGKGCSSLTPCWNTQDPRFVA